MAHQPGTKAKGRKDPAGPLYAAGRMVGFALLAAPALACIAAVALLPPYAKLAQVRHRLECERARTACLEALGHAQRRLIDALPTDKVLNARLAMRQDVLWPGREVVVIDPGAPPSASLGLAPATVQPQPPPAGWLIRMGRRLARPATRRGIFAVAVGALLAAMFLFAAPESYRRAQDAEGASDR